jgi:hypothetical protein
MRTHALWSQPAVFSIDGFLTPEECSGPLVCDGVMSILSRLTRRSNHHDGTSTPDAVHAAQQRRRHHGL